MVLTLNSNIKGNTSFLHVGFSVCVGFFFLNFLIYIFLMQKELGESMRMFEVPELEGSEE